MSKQVLPHKVAQNIFEEATAASLGSTFHVIISFHLKNKFGKDPYEVLMENPRAFYQGLIEVLGAGADAVLSLVCTFLVKNYGANCSTEEFLKCFIKSDEPSKRRLAEILNKAAS